MSLQKLATAPTKLCTGSIRTGVEAVPCKAQLSQGLCPERNEHLLPFLTGFCDAGFHEGLKIDKPTCKYFNTCGCQCHQDLWRMFAFAGAERILQDNSTWLARTTLWLPSEEDRVRSLMPCISPESDTPESVKNPTMVTTAPAMVYAPTPSGRAARGELESWVLEAVDGWVIDQLDVPCRPGWIAEQIALKHGLGRLPSSGAVDAVLKRWQAIGFAVLFQKPARFSHYTEQGTKFGLEYMKALANFDAT